MYTPIPIKRSTHYGNNYWEGFSPKLKRNVRFYQFKGIETLNDLRICLIGYDDYCEFPSNSNWSFTKYFFSESFTREYRL